MHIKRFRAAWVVGMGLGVGLGVGIIGGPAAAGQSVQRLYTENCAKCHGGAGEGGGAGTRTMLTPEHREQKNDKPYFDAIKEGVPNGGMPGFGDTLSDKQVWGLVVYIRELQAAHHRSEGGKPEVKGGVTKSTHHAFKTEVVVKSGLDTPWGIEFLPTGELLITERPGKLRLCKDGKLSSPVEGTPEVRNRGQGGLMDVTLHPNFAKNGWVYLAFSASKQGSTREGMTKIVRGKITGGFASPKWTAEETIFEARPEHYSGADLHFGCKIIFDPKDPGIVYFGIGERGAGDLAQDLKRPNGKVHRLHDDGKVPKDNPFVGRAGVYESTWSFGHRNPQGLCFDLEGNLWDTEHGPRGGDELNLVVKGANYGWPIISFGIDYSGSPYRTPWGKDSAGTEFMMPTYRWMPSIGACGLCVMPAGKAFPGWKGDLLAGGLSGANVDRLRVKVNKDGTTTLVEREELVYGQGRVRDVEPGPDGSVYIVTNGPDRILRLVKAE
ncbi:MAG: PQQ-dependent sugar dehydrogenase [Phycisphaerales bacterium]